MCSIIPYIIQTTKVFLIAQMSTLQERVQNPTWGKGTSSSKVLS